MHFLARRAQRREVPDELARAALGAVPDFVTTTQDDDDAIAAVVLVAQLPSAGGGFVRGENRMPLHHASNIRSNAATRQVRMVPRTGASVAVSKCVDRDQIEFAAATIASTAASGCDTIDTCDAESSDTVDPARSAMRRSTSTGMTLSSVPMTAQLGNVFHAGAPEGVTFATSDAGRWLADDRPAVGLGEVWRERGVHDLGLEEHLGGALGRARIAGDVEDRRGVGNAQCRVRSLEDLHHGLALVGHERVDVDEGTHVAARRRHS